MHWGQSSYKGTYWLGKFEFGQRFDDIIELRLNFLDVTLVLCL